MPKIACTTEVNHSRIKVEENRRKVVFRNEPHELYRITQIDGCLINDGLRTDCLVSHVGNASVLIELKGCDVEHACEQLLATVGRNEVKELLERKLGFLVICRQFPRINTFVIRAKQRCAKKYKAGFHVICDQRELDIDRVVDIDGPY